MAGFAGVVDSVVALRVWCFKELKVRMIRHKMGADVGGVLWDGMG